MGQPFGFLNYDVAVGGLAPDGPGTFTRAVGEAGQVGRTNPIYGCGTCR